MNKQIVQTLVIAARAVLQRPEVNGATYNVRPGMASAADNLSAAIAAAEAAFALTNG